MDSSETNGYVINVGPGDFYEDTIDFTGKPYISVVGSDIQITKVITNTLTQNLFILNNSVELSFMTLKGVGSDYSAIICEDLDGFSLIHKLSFYDCDTNVLVRSNTNTTSLYIEYVDFNGDYSYGIKVESNNGVYALANAENYYNFPGVTGSISNYASGVNSVINILGSANTGFGNDKAFYIENGANLTITSCDITGYEKGIEVGNVGQASTFDIDATSIVNCTYNMYIDHPDTFGTFQGSNSHQKIHNVSQNVYWGFLDNEDGEFDITRKISLTHADGSHVDLSTLIFEGSAMGVLSGGDISTYSELTVSISTGYGYLESSTGNVLKIDWGTTLFTVTTNSSNYIYINENSNFSQSNTLPDTKSNILFGKVITQGDEVILIDSAKFDVRHVGDSLKLFNRNALGSIYDTGSIVTSATYSLNVTDGSYYFGSKHYLPSGGTGITFSQYIRNGASWTITNTNLVTSQYDNNSGLIGMSASYFTKHTLYVSGEGVNQKYLLVVGQTQYDNINLVETAVLPIPPTYFIDSITPIASIVVRQGTSTIYEVIDIRPVIGFKSSGINSSALHSNLIGLSADDHTQYLLVSGSRGMQGNLIMASNSITGVNKVNGVTIENHASRHLPNGVDPLTTGVPSAIGTTNQEGIQNAFARQDHIHAGQNLQQVTSINATTSNTININTYSENLNQTSLNLYARDAEGNGVGANIYGGGIGAYINGNEALVIDNSNYGISLYNPGSKGILSYNQNGIAVELNLGTYAKGIVINSGSSSTGNFIELNNNGTDKLVISQSGTLTINVVSEDKGLVINSDNENAIDTYSNRAVGLRASSTEGTAIEAIALSDLASAVVAQNTNVDGVSIVSYATHGTALKTYNNSGIGAELNQGATSRGLVINGGASSTGNFIELNNNGTDKLVISQLGTVNINPTVNQNGLNITTLWDDSVISKGINIVSGGENTGIFIDNSVNGKALNIVGNGNDTSILVTGGDIGMNLYNASTTGLAISGGSSESIYITNVSGTGIRLYQSVESAVELNLGPVAKGLVINSGSSSTGDFIKLNKNGVDKLVVNQYGEITATKIIKEGGTSSQYLMADGSVSVGVNGATGPAGATGSTGATGPAGAGGTYTFISTVATYSLTGTTGTTIVKCDGTTASYTINLPTAVGNTSTFIFKKTAGTYSVTIDAFSTQTIDGSLTAVIARVYESITLVSDNANWWLI